MTATKAHYASPHLAGQEPLSIACPEFRTALDASFAAQAAGDHKAADTLYHKATAIARAFQAGIAYAQKQRS